MKMYDTYYFASNINAVNISIKLSIFFKKKFQEIFRYSSYRVSLILYLHAMISNINANPSMYPQKFYQGRKLQ